MASPRMTVQTQLILRTLLDDPTREWYGLEIYRTLGLDGGTAYPILRRLEGHGWLVSRQEDPDPIAPDRPRRRYYLLTPTGVARAREALAGARLPNIR